jgi:hypothetical protein
MKPVLVSLSLIVMGLIGVAVTTASESPHIVLHGRDYPLRRFGPASSRVAIVSSGDGGWVHLAPHIAEGLAARGWTVVGFDSRDYLIRGNDTGSALTPSDIARDYGALIAQAVAPTTRVTLIGVSEGAGLSVVAAADAAVKPRLAGVVTVGLGDHNELAWHWKDSVIYITKGVPHEPLFLASDFLPRTPPVPLAMIRSSHDEFVPPSEADRLQMLAGPGSRGWKVEAADHRFSDNLPGFDSQLNAALEWIAGRT